MKKQDVIKLVKPGSRATLTGYGLESLTYRLEVQKGCMLYFLVPIPIAIQNKFVDENLQYKTAVPIKNILDYAFRYEINF